MSLLAWLTLSLADGLGPVLTARLVEKAGNPDDAVNVSQSVLRTIEGVGTNKALAIYEGLRRARDDAARELDRAAALNVSIVPLDADRYPILLRLVHGAPVLLYVKGTLEPRDLHAVAIVGSRKCSVYGREQAERFGSNLAGIGVTVVSGGARGIDTYAHKGALVPRNGRTIAVLGSGVDVVYPPENVELFDRIAGNGAVVSEFPLGTPPTAENFPRRNRIVAAMSRGTLVVEADVKSGALITAKRAMEIDRPVFAVPGRIDNPLSAGPHALIRDGATLVEKIGDLIDNLGPVPEQASTRTSPTLFDASLKESLTEEPPAKAQATRPLLSDRQVAIVEALQGETLDVDAIADRTSLPTHVVLQELTMLTLRGAVRRGDGQTFSRR